MYKYVIRRLIMLIPVLLGVTFVIFTLLHFTDGDPARMILGNEASEEEVLSLREEMGLNDPFLVQYVRYVGNIVLKGDLGTSYTTKAPVMNEIMARLPTTALLATLGVLVAVILGVTAGIISATKQYSIFYVVATAVSLFGVSIPGYWLGLMLIIVFSIQLGWLPPSGFDGPIYWILPAICIGSTSASTIMRMTRSSMLEVLRQDYIRTARSKGQKESVVVLSHALSNALVPVITVIGIAFGHLLGGAILTESIFNIPGLGKLMIDSIKSRNFPVVQGGVLVTAFIFCMINLIVDIIYAYIDPRIKSQYKT